MNCASRCRAAVLLTFLMTNSSPSATLDKVQEEPHGEWSAVLYNNISGNRLFCALETENEDETVLRVVRYHEDGDTFIEIYNVGWDLLEGSVSFSMEFMVGSERYEAELAGRSWGDSYTHDFIRNHEYNAVVGLIARAAAITVRNSNGVAMAEFEGPGSGKAASSFADCWEQKWQPKGAVPGIFSCKADDVSFSVNMSFGEWSDGVGGRGRADFGLEKNVVYLHFGEERFHLTYEEEASFLLTPAGDSLPTVCTSGDPGRTPSAEDSLPAADSIPGLPLIERSIVAFTDEPNDIGEGRAFFNLFPSSDCELSFVNETRFLYFCASEQGVSRFYFDIAYSDSVLVLTGVSLKGEEPNLGASLDELQSWLAAVDDGQRSYVFIIEGDRVYSAADASQHVELGEKLSLRDVGRRFPDATVSSKYEQGEEETVYFAVEKDGVSLAIHHDEREVVTRIETSTPGLGVKLTHGIAQVGDFATRAVGSHGYCNPFFEDQLPYCENEKGDRVRYSIDDSDGACPLPEQSIGVMVIPYCIRISAIALYRPAEGD